MIGSFSTRKLRVSTSWRERESSKDLSDGQKAWLEENRPGKEGPNAGSAAVPAAGPAYVFVGFKLESCSEWHFLSFLVYAIPTFRAVWTLEQSHCTGSYAFLVRDRYLTLTWLHGNDLNIPRMGKFQFIRIRLDPLLLGPDLIISESGYHHFIWI